jgi:hypothetical protein
MKKKYAVLIAALVLGSSSLAHAGQILSPGLPTGIGSAGACYVRNTGTTPVTVQVTLFSNNSIVAAEYHDHCSIAPLHPGHTCLVVVDALPDASFAACRATSGSVAKLRGTLEIRQSWPSYRVRASEDLR